MIPELIDTTKTYVAANYPHLLEIGDIKDVLVWDVKNNQEVPGATLAAKRLFIKINKIEDSTTIIVLFDNNLIGYRLIKLK